MSKLKDFLKHYKKKKEGQREANKCGNCIWGTDFNKEDIPKWEPETTTNTTTPIFTG